MRKSLESLAHNNSRLQGEGRRSPVAVLDVGSGGQDSIGESDMLYD